VPQRAIDAGAIGRFGSLDPTTGGESSRFSLSGSLRRSLGDGRVEASAWMLRYRLNLFSNFTYGLDRPDTGDQFEQADARTAYGLRVARSWRTSALGRPGLTTVGAQARQDRIEVGLHDTLARERLATVRDDRVTATAAGVFAEHTTFWTDRLRTVAGVRVDRHDNRVAASLDANGGRSAQTLASPKLAMVFQPSAVLETFASVGRGFHSNDARGTTARIDPRTGEPLVPVQALVPTLGSEVGLRWAPMPGFVASIAAWQLRLGSELVFVGDAGTRSRAARVRRRGVEVSARWLPMPWLALDADVSASTAPVHRRRPGRRLRARLGGAGRVARRDGAGPRPLVGRAARAPCRHAPADRGRLGAVEPVHARRPADRHEGRPARPTCCSTCST
jgi:hypothetical protein